jgi:hypothetical protein
MQLQDWFGRDNPIRVVLRKQRLGCALVDWEAGGRPIPTPDLVKRGLIKAYARRFKCVYFVETGTYSGETVQAGLSTFRRIWSIELSPEFAAAAKKRFASQPHVRIIHGDSGKLLREVVPQLDQPTLFWLDGHYCGDHTAKGATECPILSELDAVFSGHAASDVILIDDARLFTGKNDYPSIQELRNYFAVRSREFQLYVADDIIRIHHMD